MKRERRKPTRSEWERITSKRPVVRKKIPPPRRKERAVNPRKEADGRMEACTTISKGARAPPPVEAGCETCECSGVSLRLTLPKIAASGSRLSLR